MRSYRLIQGDALDVLRTLPLESVDVCVTDPPYGETSASWDRLVRGWQALILPLLKPHGSLWVFGSLRSHLRTAADFTGWHLAQDLIWEKQNGTGFDVDRFKRVHEQVAHWYPERAAWSAVHKEPQKVVGKARPTAAIKARGLTPHRSEIGSKGYEYTGERLMRSVIAAPNAHGKGVELDTTPKPFEVLEPLIRYSCPPGGVVLDPFCGSGTTLVAAQRAGRDFIGVDLRPECIALAHDRIRGDAPLLNRAAGGVA